MQLYLVEYNNDDDEDLDLLMTADSPVAASLMWRAEWSDYLDPSEFQSPVAYGVPTSPDVVRIFEIRPSPDCAGVLSWHDVQPGHHGEVALVGYLRR